MKPGEGEQMPLSQPNEAAETIVTSLMWPPLAAHLADIFGTCLTYVRMDPADPDRAALAQQIMDAVQYGITETAMLAAEINADIASMHRDTLDSTEHPMLRFAHTFEAAFRSVAVVALLIGGPSALPVDSSSRELISLAQSAADVLARAVGLVFGQRHLGSVVQWCERVGTVEDRADVVFHNAVTERLRKAAKSAGGTTWTAEQAKDLHLLSALEALTDRCEEIADALLIVALVV
jgi:hypothetical protein